jgi:hypothetical protein
MNTIINVRFDPIETVWRVERDGGARASAKKDTQDDARKAAINIGRRTGATVRVWTKAGDDFRETQVTRG